MREIPTATRSDSRLTSRRSRVRATHRPLRKCLQGGTRNEGASLRPAEKSADGNLNVF
jgi:hypothetical protein